MLDWRGFPRMSLFNMHGGPKDRVDQPLTIRSQRDTRTMKKRSGMRIHEHGSDHRNTRQSDGTF